MSKYSSRRDPTLHLDSITNMSNDLLISKLSVAYHNAKQASDQLNTGKYNSFTDDYFAYYDEILRRLNDSYGQLRKEIRETHEK